MQKNIIKELQGELKDLRSNFEANEKAFLEYKESSEKTMHELEENEKLLHSLVETAAGKIGQDFFDNIVKELSKWLGADCVLIGRMTEDERIEAVPLYLDGKISHGFSYQLAGSPCDITTRTGYCAYSEDVINLFPADQILVDLHAEGYIGTALSNEAGVVNGVICAVSRNKLKIPPYAKDIMKIIGARVSAEIERAKIEEALKKSQKDLTENNATKDKFLRILAHDLTNPFNSILGYSDYLKSEFYNLGNEEKYESIIELNASLHNLYFLIDNLFNWTRTQAEEVRTFPEEFDIIIILNEVKNLFNQLAKRKNISLSLITKGEIKCFADKNMIRTVIRNLVNNALKFTPEKGKIVMNVENNNNEIRVSISDNGIGMDEDQVEKLFDINTHFSTKGTDSEQGSGLGLLLIKEFVTMNNGTISVDCQKSKGCTFSFTLPVYNK